VTKVIAINSKLFVVEGLPGSGKSAAAEYVAEYLASSGVSARLYDESDLNHPADYTFHAYMREDQIRALAPAEQRQVLSEGQKKSDGYIIPLTKISVSLFEKILPYKIYGRLDWETESVVMLEHWEEFAGQWQWSDTVHIFDGCLLQNPVSEMMRFDYGIREIGSYIRNIYDIIARLNPVVIYLRSTDIKKLVEETKKARGTGWLDMMVEAFTSQGYGKRSGFTGYDGCLACLQEQQRCELTVLESLPLKKLMIDDPYDNWAEAQAVLDAFLSSLFAAAGKH
jgi:hypothetical protein